VTFSSKLLSALKNKDYHNLSLLRIDSELSCGDLVDGGALNIYAAQAIIDFLNFERLAKIGLLSPLSMLAKATPLPSTKRFEKEEF
jgi:hypothetical protein